MVAKGMDACDNVSCSSVLYKCFGHGRNMNDAVIPTPQAEQHLKKTCKMLKNLQKHRTTIAPAANYICSSSTVARQILTMAMSLRVLKHPAHLIISEPPFCFLSVTV